MLLYLLLLGVSSVAESSYYGRRWFFKNQNPWMSSWTGIFKFGTFLCITQWTSSSISASRPSLSPCSSCFMLIIDLSFLIYSFSSIFYSKIVLFPLNPFAGLSSCILHLLLSRIFFYHFVKSCFIVLLDSNLVSFESCFFRQYLLIYLSKFYVQTCLLFCFNLSVPVCPSGIFLSFAFFVVVSLYVLQDYFAIQVLYFCSGSLVKYRRNHGLVSLWYKFTRFLGSIPCCVIPKALKMVLDTSKLNPLQYKVCIRGKVEQSRERSSLHPYSSV